MAASKPSAMAASNGASSSKAPLIESDEETADPSHEPVGRKVAPLPGHLDHHCTDPVWILILMVAFGPLYLPISAAVTEGDLSKFTRGFDYTGRMCGRDLCDNGQVCGRFIYYCSKFGEEGVDTLHPICVDSCPTSNLTSHVCFDEETGSTVLVQDWPTEEFNMKCLQRTHHLKEVKEHHRKRLAGDLSRFKAGGHTSGTVLDCIASIAKAKWHLVIVVFVSIAAGFMYMLFLWSCLRFLIYGSLVLVILIPSAFGIFHLFLVWRGGGFSAALGGDQAVQQSLWMGSVGICVGAFLWCTLKQIFDRIQTAEGCIVATTECLFEIPCILLEPAISLLLKMLVAVPLIFFVLGYASTGEMLLIQDQDGSLHRRLSLEPKQWGLIAYCLFVLAWSLELVHNATQYVLAYISEMWYFTPYVDDQKVDVPQVCLFVEATFNLFRYHLGSVILASLLKTVFRVPKILSYGVFLLGCCKYAKHKEAAAENGHSCTCAFMFATLRKEGFMDMAITSASYCEATEHATETLDDSSTELVLTWTQIIFELGGWALMTGVAALYMAVTVNSNPHFSDPEDDMFLKEPDAVVIAASLLGLAVGISFMNVFDAIGDTILYCLALEEQRYRQLHGAGNPFYNDSSWCTCRDNASGGFFSWMMGYTDEDDEDHHRVQYAPRSLKSH